MWLLWSSSPTYCVTQMDSNVNVWFVCIFQERHKARVNAMYQPFSGLKGTPLRFKVLLSFSVYNIYLSSPNVSFIFTLLYTLGATTATFCSCKILKFRGVHIWWWHNSLGFQRKSVVENPICRSLFLGRNKRQSKGLTHISTVWIWKCLKLDISPDI